MNKKLIKEISSQLIDYFEYCDKMQSGNLGYPKSSSYEPTSFSSKKADPTPNHAIPLGIKDVYNMMMDCPKDHTRVLEKKYNNPRLTDHHRAQMLHCSVQNYYILLGRAQEWVCGYYTRHYSDRKRTTGA